MNNPHFRYRVNFMMHQMRLPDGYIAVPNSKMAAIVTYLEMTRPAGGSAEDTADDAAFQRLTGRDLDRYIKLFGDVGLPWLWFSRLAMKPAELEAILNDPRVEALAICRNGRDIGLAELDFRVSGEAEISFFGLVPDMLGKGLASPSFRRLIGMAWGRDIRRLSVHTCTLDHPSALGFYMKHGFRPYKRAIEIADDPRIAGTIPAHAGHNYPALGT